jgi:REP element-mobilizing transposase RayT
MNPHFGDTIAGFTVMTRTIGYHLVKSTHGMWLPGDDRGHWSEAWDEHLGFVEPHKLHPGDLVRKRMAEERMKHAPVRLSQQMMDVVVETIAECAVASAWEVAAFAIESTHFHLLITYSSNDIEQTAKWIAQRTTKAMHQKTRHEGPVWCGGRWRQFLFDESHWQNTIRYIERHNLRKGLPAKPYSFILGWMRPAKSPSKAGDGIAGARPLK